jgi:tetratricopeptide (TPR) repeat protein
MKRFAVPLLILAGLNATAVSQAQDDQIYPKGATPVRGAITTISPDKVTIQATGAERTIEVKDILRVTFGDEPSELGNARDGALAGQYENALADLKKIDASKVQNPVVKQDIDYYTAFCSAKLAMTTGGDKQAATDALYGFVRQNATSFHFFEAAELMGDLAYAASKYDEAFRYYGGLSKAPWPEYKMKASALQGRAKAAEGKNDEALALFEPILASGLNTPEAMEQKMHAMVGKAVCLAATGKADEGIAMIEDLIAKNDPSDAKLFARAYNALGACYEKAGKTQDALLAYLHTDVLFFADREAHAEALYHLSKLWAAVNKSDRGVEAGTLLRSRYPGSRWASMN